MIHPDRKQAPDYILAQQVNYLKPEVILLDNGMPVYLMEGGSQDIIKIEMVFRSGSYHQHKPLVAQSVADLLKAGTKSKTSEEINHIWDFYGASLQVDAQKDIISIMVFCLTKHVKPLLSLLVEMLSNATFPQEEMDIFLNNLMQKHIVNKQKVQHLARVHFTELLYGPDHPYGRTLKEDDFKSLSYSDIDVYFKKYIQPANAVCIISGKYPTDITTVLEETMNKFSWFASSIPESPDVSQFLTKETKHLITKEDAVQSSLRVGKNMINRQNPDYHKVVITNTLLGGYFGSRLMQNIRQDKGYTYGINSAVVNLMKSAYFFISTQVGKDVCYKALDEIYNELKYLRTKPSEEQELTMLRNYLSAGLLRSFDGPFMQSERFKEMLLFGLDYSHYDHYLATLMSITNQDIMDTANVYFHEKDMIELVVG